MVSAHALSTKSIFNEGFEADDEEAIRQFVIETP